MNDKEGSAETADKTSDQTPATEALLWAIKTRDEQELGPADATTVAQWIRDGTITRDIRVRQGNSEWQLLTESALAKNFVIKVLFHPVDAYADAGASRGKDVGIFVGAFALWFVAGFASNTGSTLEALGLGVTLGVIGVAILVVFGIASRRQCCLFLLLVLTGLLPVLISLAGALVGAGIGWLMGFIIGTLIGFMREKQHRLPARP